MIYTRKHFSNWFLLAFLAGVVNVGGYMACQRFVTHVTGFATLFGVEVVEWHWQEGFGMLSVPLFFIWGTMISAFLVERRVGQGQRPAYALVMGIATFCISVVAIGGMLGWFGHFGHTSEVTRVYLLLALLCLASGLQNALVTSVSGAVVRTTHMTGLTTDLGVGLVRTFFPVSGQITDPREKRSNQLRMGIIGSFVVGSMVGAIAFINFGYSGFILPSAIALYITWIAKKVWQQPEFYLKPQK